MPKHALLFCSAGLLPLLCMYFWYFREKSGYAGLGSGVYFLSKVGEQLEVVRIMWLNLELFSLYLSQLDQITDPTASEWYLKLVRDTDSYAVRISLIWRYHKSNKRHLFENKLSVNNRSKTTSLYSCLSDINNIHSLSHCITSLNLA